MKYTLVQHSGYGYAGNPQFQRAVETRSIPDKLEHKVLEKGGVVLEGYVAAEDRAEVENYPADVQGLIPRVRGAFSTLKVDGLHLYLPAKATADA